MLLRPCQHKEFDFSSPSAYFLLTITCTNSLLINSKDGVLFAGSRPVYAEKECLSVIITECRLSLTSLNLGFDDSASIA